MKKLPISPGWYLFYTGFVYLLAGTVDIFIYRFCDPELLSMAYCVILSLPLIFTPIARFVGMKTFWERRE
jgi:hypothetical protein